MITISHRVIAASAGQDRIGLRRGDRQSVFVLADGAGGVTGGREAAEAVVRACLVAEDLTPDTAAHVLEAIDGDLFARGGESTAVLVAVDQEARRIVGASVGDSRAYVFLPTGERELTADQLRKPRLGSGAARAVGFAYDLPPRGWTVLIASDGLFNYAPMNAITEAVAALDLEACADACVRLPRLASGRLQDDLSIVLVRGAARA